MSTKSTIAYGSTLGSMVFGFADTSRDEQIDKGVAYYQRLRDRQQQVKAAIAALQVAQTSPAP